jgi:hypothetical protein
MADKLHYSMAEVEKDYSATYSMFMKAAAVGIIGAIIYFFALAVFLGGWGHTHSDAFVRDFVADGRLEPEYKGTKLPMFENPALAAASAAARPHDPSVPRPELVAEQGAESVPASTEVQTPASVSPAAAPVAEAIAPAAH